MKLKRILCVGLMLTTMFWPFPPKQPPKKTPGCPSSCRPEWGCYCA